MMQHDPGLAASPQVRNNLEVGRREILFLRFSPVGGQAPCGPAEYFEIVSHNNLQTWKRIKYAAKNQPQNMNARVNMPTNAGLRKKNPIQNG
jgi:hypothetical protein